ncbi:hypothetical protein AOQ84DRAFT_436146 [Glonium stellatum]|uniref:Uncharacterized protein n=1 Tax=Glonium stellatum TaxID=574774 RepID=A0A8E2FAM2_9PEZI|nr:hypothetical protein AOQ84DRAFT_436146 [Glonium stellatum]
MYQHLFSCNSVLSVWRNLRTTSSRSDLVLTFQYQPTEQRRQHHVPKVGDDALERPTTKNRPITLIVPWKSLQSQKLKLQEKDHQLAEALVALCGETLFTELPSSVQKSVQENPWVEVRHIAAGISRQMNKTEFQMIDNAPFSRGKNLYTGGELIRKFLPIIQTLFNQQPVPFRMTWELLMELKDIVLYGMQDLDKGLLEDELNNYNSFDELDDALSSTLGGKERWLDDEAEIWFHLESLETTSSSMKRAGIDDFCAKTVITVRRLLDKRRLYEFNVEKKKRQGRCGDYARCMKWAGTSWKQSGGCRRGCANEDEDPAGLPSWHSTSRHYSPGGKYSQGDIRETIEDPT